MSHPDSAVTAVVTSCGRHDLLCRTLDSFFAFNTHPLTRTIVVEDGPAIPSAITETYKTRDMLWLSTGRRVGQIAAIDYAYSNVGTPYIFHLEDDWEFHRSFFIERSLVVLGHDPDCLLVWLRAVNDTQRHPVEPGVFVEHDACWQHMTLDHDIQGTLWHGFCFNPGLRRLSDYVAIGGYGKHAKFDFQVPWRAENLIAKLYRRAEFHAAILTDADGAGYVRHIGRNRRVPPPDMTGCPDRP